MASGVRSAPLFPSGELSEEEWALLQVHLAYCGCCRVVFKEYRHLADNVMPVVASIASSDSESKPGTSSFSPDPAEQRLMSQLSSRPTDHKSHHRRKTGWQTPAGSLRFERGWPHRFAPSDSELGDNNRVAGASRSFSRRNTLPVPDRVPGPHGIGSMSFIDQ